MTTHASGSRPPERFHLERFVAAQDPVYARVLEELRAGRKRTHWMWYVFPQISGLGSSPTAQHYAIASLDEARAYLAHPVLGLRLIECTGLVNALKARTPRAGKTAEHTPMPDPRHLLDDIFTFPDNLKFHSSMTLFSRAAPEQPAFQQALQTFFAGQSDEATLQRL